MSDIKASYGNLELKGVTNMQVNGLPVFGAASIYCTGTRSSECGIHDEVIVAPKKHVMTIMDELNCVPRDSYVTVDEAGNRVYKSIFDKPTEPYEKEETMDNDDYTIDRLAGIEGNLHKEVRDIYAVKQMALTHPQDEKQLRKYMAKDVKRFMAVVKTKSLNTSIGSIAEDLPSARVAQRQWQSDNDGLTAERICACTRVTAAIDKIKDSLEFEQLTPQGAIAAAMELVAEDYICD